MITLDSIKDTFRRMEENGVNTQKELLWGYFFTNKTKEKLEKITDIFRKDGYQIIDIYQDKNDLYWLNIEKVEVHSPESLYKRCKEFYQFAEKNNLESFDGYDVGNPDKTKPITEVK